LKTVVDRLLNVEQIKKGRVHPISVLSALKTYAQGHGTKGSLSWTPVARINDALNEMLYLAFDQVEPTGKNLLLGFDISGSMDSSFISNLGISAREAAAVMGMVTARAEKNHYAIGFTSSGGYYSRGDYGVTALDISPRDRLDVVVQKMQKMPMGGTDCALAVMHALKNKLDVDGFVVYTDNETYAGSIKVDEALKRYRKEMNKPTAKLIAVGMTATKYSIVDDKDRYCMNVVGFDTAAPSVISDFMRQK
jgi:60 kDa SS-A/Ro ribonucleoprotein